MTKIFLVSDSPRRKRLAKAFFGSNISFLKNRFKEPINTPSAIGKIKGIAVKKVALSTLQLTGGIAFAADTVVIHKGNALGKPGTLDNASVMLRKISGSKVVVITAVALLDIRTGKMMTGIESTDVWIDKLTDKQIRSYVNSKEPLDKAGAFAIQEKGAFFVKKIHGDYFNVVGLPVRLLNKMFRAFKAEVF
jgi:septum formation protein